MEYQRNVCILWQILLCEVWMSRFVFVLDLWLCWLLTNPSVLPSELGLLPEIYGAIRIAYHGMNNTDEHIIMSIKHPARTHLGSLLKWTLTIKITPQLGIVFPKIAEGDVKTERLLEFVSLYMILLALESRLVSNILLEYHCLSH